MARRSLGLLLGIMSLVGCGGEVGGDAESSEASVVSALGREGLPAAGASGITVMTRNLYVGTDVVAVLGAASAAQLPVLVAQAFADVQASDPAARMAKIADEIVATRPHLVGLQEAALIRTQFPGDSLSPTPTPATTVAFDFLQLLVTALEDRGVTYVPVVVGEEADVELPALTLTGLLDVRLTDRDVLLARSDVVVSNPEASHFATNLTAPLGDTGLSITVFRGWVEADAMIGGRTVHVANTHLEAVSGAIQAIQATELAAALADELRPVLLLGDFNWPAEGAGSSSYAGLLGAGYVDLWTRAHRGDPGYTCCNADDLQNPYPTYSERIDDVFVNLPETANKDFVGGVSATLVGDALADRTADGLWPSDHAGVVVTVRLPRGLRFADR